MSINKISPFPVLETERLILRNITIADAPEILIIRSHPINMKYTGRQPAATIDDARTHINKLINGMTNHEWINWTMTIKEKDKAMGLIGFWNYHETLPQVDIGYELHPDYHGKGYMTEAMRAVLDFGFSKMGIKTIHAELHRDNEKSLNLLKRFDFVEDKDFHLEEEPDMVLWELSENSRK